MGMEAPKLETAPDAKQAKKPKLEVVQGGKEQDVNVEAMDKAAAELAKKEGIKLAEAQERLANTMTADSEKTFGRSTTQEAVNTALDRETPDDDAKARMANIKKGGFMSRIKSLFS